MMQSANKELVVEEPTHSQGTKFAFQGEQEALSDEAVRAYFQADGQTHIDSVH